MDDLLRARRNLLLLIGLDLADQALAKSTGRGPMPRQRALDRLARMESEIERLTPYEFSIRVSDILRAIRDRAISAAGDSPDFSGISQHARREITFSGDEQSLLTRFPQSL